MMKDDISASDKAIGWLVFIDRLFASSFGYFLIAYLLVDNWQDAMLMRGGFKKDAKLRLRKRDITKSISGRLVRAFARRINDCKAGDNKILLRYNNRQVVLNYTNDYQFTNTLTGIKEQFIEEPYAGVDFKGREVLDIGASIGDSAIYFALNGAKHVVGLEPYPFTYNVAKMNVRSTGLAPKITLLNQACRSREGTTIIDSNFQNNDRHALKHFRNGKRIKVNSLAGILRDHHIIDGVLKLDCEGYEYEIIENADPDLLSRFKSIVIEYHFGYKQLEEKLRRCGFNVRHTLPFHINRIDDKTNVLCGFIYAERN